MTSVDLSSYLTPRMREVIAKNLANRDEKLLQLQIEECLKFLYVASREGGGLIPVSKEVDDIWHELILETSFYEEFCRSLPGGVFLNHASIGMNEYSETSGKEKTIRESLDWLPKYYSYFGKFTKERAQLWSIVQFLENEIGLSLDEINEIAKNSTPEKNSQSVN